MPLALTQEDFLVSDEHVKAHYETILKCRDVFGWYIFSAK